ncbi:FRAS1-related extracellular matrix protein 1-like [Ptychodera flava]|uniref:FRAS1-related extracellular matrix protein 1-like n=1 Tax=Ptychodera flava TaxID=63121 RepID=UPI003969F8C1
MDQFRFLFIGLVSVILTSPVIGQLVAVNKGLTVPIGRTTFLDPADLTFHVYNPEEECKVEVVLNEPITQRVGQLSPQVFNCQFYPNTVKYRHSGSPLLDSDTVKLKVYRLTDTQTYSQTFDLKVEIQNVSHRVFYPVAQLKVDKFEGFSDPIDRNVLEFRYNRVINASCSIRFSSALDHLPQSGQLVKGEGDDKNAVRFLNVNCEEFLNMGIRYEHLIPPSPDIDFIALAVHVLDPLDGYKEYSERIHLPVHIVPGFKNQKPQVSFVSMLLLDADQFVLTTITPFVLSAQDEETHDVELVFNVTKPLESGQGDIVHLDELAQPVGSFTQNDINNFNIAFKPPNTSHTERRVFNVEVKAYDSHFEASEPIMLMLAVRAASTNAPRISLNNGLTLLEGQSRPITSENLQIVDNDNLQNIRLIIVGGLDYGVLRVNHKPAIMFTPKDLKDGTISYHHDDSDSIKDKIVLRITDGFHSSRLTFPISILPKDDSPPFLITNLGFDLDEGDTVQLTRNMLQASDADSSDDYITYDIIRQPTAGEIVRKYPWQPYGYPLEKFTQKDLFEGLIYYRHLGQEKFRDYFDFVLTDGHVPPNQSGAETVIIHIRPVDDLKPRPVAGRTRSLRVLETDIIHIEKHHLEYTDVESDDTQLVYTVTTPPYFVDTHSLTDAGRLFSTVNVTMPMKDPQMPPLRSFTQHQVNHRKIAFMPPFGDIGKRARQVQFIFSVSDPFGNIVLGQVLNVTVLPVNNQAPIIYTARMVVREGESLILGSSVLAASDQDTDIEDLTFVIQTLPSYGIIQRLDVDLKTGDTFTVDDVNSYRVRYNHDGSDVDRDHFVLSVSDGIQSTVKQIPIHVLPVDDQPPRLKTGLNPHIAVPEGGTLAFSPTVLAAVDQDTDDMMLRFIIVSPPTRGIIQRDLAVVSTFTQRDIIDGRVTYTHISGEIGSSAVYDRISFVVSDHHIPITSDLPLHDLNVTILPVDNRAPVLALGDILQVPEGGQQALTSNVLRVDDSDTVAHNIGIVIVRQPQWGFLENIQPSPGHEKSNAGKSISSFLYQDILDKNVNYVQSRHQGVEPTSDQFVVYATDGKSTSPQVTVSVLITPENDEVPNFISTDITLNEGGVYRLDNSMINAVDQDIPKETLVFSISKPPRHGDIMDMKGQYKRSTGNSANLLHDFTLEAFRNSMELVYQHDGSETASDDFSLRLTDGQHTVRKTISVTVIPVNDQSPILVKNEGMTINIRESRVISSMLLMASDSDTSDEKVVFFVQVTPKRGLLQVKRTLPGQLPKWEVVEEYMNFTQSDINMNLLRYIHTGDLGSKGSDKFQFVLTDGKHTSGSENFDIEILNTQKDDIEIINKGIEVREGDFVVITPDVLSAHDNTNLLDDIVFTVVDVPSEGQVEDIAHPELPITSFSQLDLAGHRVIYKHTKKDRVDWDSLRFVVTNGLTSKHGTLHITIHSVDDALPTLQMVNEIVVNEGGARLITESDLKLQDPDTDVRGLTYILTTPPEHGHIVRLGEPVYHKFTQEEIDNYQIMYKQDGGRSSIDSFSFIATDNTNAGFLVDGSVQYEPMVMHININTRDTEAPYMVNSVPTTTLDVYSGRYANILTNRNLRAEDKDTLDEGLVYVVTRQPLHGILEDVPTRETIYQTFTQQDINERNVAYVLNGDVKETNDSFLFEVRDSHGNVLRGQRFDFHWTVIQLRRPEYIVCENIGTLSLSVVRSGYLDQSSFVTIKVKDQTAVARQDFIPSRAEQLQFDPGVSTATWSVTIVDDGLEEDDEKFKVTLKSPISAILGDNAKSSVLIADAKNGVCDDGKYSNMIHGNVESEAITDGSDVGYMFESIPDNGAQVSSQIVWRNESTTIWRNHGIIPVKTREKVPDVIEGSVFAGVSVTESESAPPDKDSVPSLPSRCDQSAVGLLHVDSSTGKLYRCDGNSWKEKTESDSNREKANPCGKGWTYHSRSVTKLGKERKRGMQLRELAENNTMQICRV